METFCSMLLTWNFVQRLSAIIQEAKSFLLWCFCWYVVNLVRGESGHILLNTLKSYHAFSLVPRAISKNFKTFSYNEAKCKKQFTEKFVIFGKKCSPQQKYGASMLRKYVGLIPSCLCVFLPGLMTIAQLYEYKKGESAEFPSSYSQKYFS